MAVRATDTVVADLYLELSILNTRCEFGARCTGVHNGVVAKADHGVHQPLLRAIVQIALDPPPTLIGGSDDTRA
jgi:hypothetical protein